MARTDPSPPYTGELTVLLIMLTFLRRVDNIVSDLEAGGFPGLRQTAHLAFAWTDMWACFVVHRCRKACAYWRTRARVVSD